MNKEQAGLLVGMGLGVMLGIMLTILFQDIQRLREDEPSPIDEVIEIEQKCELYAKEELGMNDPYCYYYYSSDRCSCREHYNNPCVEWNETEHTKTCVRRTYSHEEQWDRGMYTSKYFKLIER